MRLVISIIVMIVMAFVAQKKGFSPWRWILAGGIPGFIILLCLPSSTKEGIDEETIQKRLRIGNRVGTIISIVCVVLIVLFIAAVILFAPPEVKQMFFNRYKL